MPAPNRTENLENSLEYQELLLDNPICARRFHLCFNPGAKKVSNVVVKCPHCRAIIFSEENHPPVFLAREENLVSSPSGKNPLMTECFLKNK